MKISIWDVVAAQWLVGRLSHGTAMVYQPRKGDIKEALQKPDKLNPGKQFWERFNDDALMSQARRIDLFGVSTVNYTNIESFFTTNFTTLF